MSEECTRFVDGRFFLNDSGLTLSPKDVESLLPTFLDRLILSLNREIFSLGRGAAQKNLDVPAFKALRISYPSSIADQRRIVAILDEAFEGIATAKAHAERNLRNTREVFESRLEQMFVDPDVAWRTEALDSIGVTQTGSTPKTSEPENYGAHMPFVKPGDFNRDGTIGYENEGLSELGVRKARLVAAGSALMVCIGATIGKAGYTEREVTTNQQVNAWTPTGEISGKFVYYQMISKDFQRRVREGAGQATLPIINKSKWSALTVVVPQAPEDQNRIVEELDALQADSMSLEDVYQRKLAALDELKQSLLHQAFSGTL
jgi:type I restriction enzyme S subunit